MAALDIRFDAVKRLTAGINARRVGSFKPGGRWMSWKLDRFSRPQQPHSK
jgi:hypothetical protein